MTLELVRLLEPASEAYTQAGNRVVLRDQSGTGRGVNPQEPCDLAKEVNMEYDKLTDVMHLDLCLPSSAARVDVIDVGDCVGFPGQVVARVDSERMIIYGITIQNFKSFRRKLFWKYRMVSIQRALQFMLRVLMAALWIDQSSRPAHLHA